MKTAAIKLGVDSFLRFREKDGIIWYEFERHPSSVSAIKMDGQITPYDFKNLLSEMREFV